MASKFHDSISLELRRSMPHTHQDILDSLDITNLIEQFINRSSIRRKLFSIWRLESQQEKYIKVHVMTKLVLPSVYACTKGKYALIDCSFH